MDLIKIDIPPDHLDGVRLNEVDHDQPHSMALNKVFILKYDYHKWLMENAPNQFYALYTSAETLNTAYDDGIELRQILFHTKLYTYKNTALLYKLIWF